MRFFLKNGLKKYNPGGIFNTSQFEMDVECGGVAQLVRVPPCHGGCCGFESRLSRHFFA